MQQLPIVGDIADACGTAGPATGPVLSVPPIDPARRRGTFSLVSLGCPKALVDSERILTQLRTEGYEISPTYDGAALVVVNTCGFIDSAKAESLEAIGEALEENGRVLVTGCLGADATAITDVHPAVLGVSGPAQYEAVLEAIHAHAPYKAPHDPHRDLVPPQGIKLTPRHYAYLKISEGCNHKCSFCIIPSMRGRLVSRSIDNVMNEAERLVAAGVKELLVVSQDTSAYGSDLKYGTSFWQGRPLKSSFAGLCHALSTLDVWTRLHYVYPYPHVDDVLPMMSEDRLLPYLDIPLQHGSPTVLKRMKRPAASEKTLDRIKSWRSVCPDITLRSTFIVGFPGETESEFNELLDFIKEAKLDRVGCFKYSAVEGATANELDNPVPEEVKEERWHRFMALQQEISAERLQQKVGQSIDVMIDEIGSDGAVGRSKGDAPEIDGVVYVADAANLKPGDIVNRRVLDADDYDLWTA